MQKFLFRYNAIIQSMSPAAVSLSIENTLNSRVTYLAPHSQFIICPPVVSASRLVSNKWTHTKGKL